MAGWVRHAEYKAWWAARKRCNCPTDKMFKHYGGRGIIMCAEWQQSFAAFLAHIGLRPSRRHTLDRRDNDKGYEPGNVRWTTWREQHLNKRLSIPRMDLTGQRFGRLTALNAEPRRPKRMTHWRCRCDCGTVTTVGLAHLRDGHTRSCGCLKKENTGQPKSREAHLAASP